MIGNSGRRKADSRVLDAMTKRRAEPSGAGAVSHIIERSRVLYHVLFSQSLNQARPPPPNPARSLCHADRRTALLRIFLRHRLLIFSLLVGFYIYFPLAYTIRNSPHPSLPSATRLCAAHAVSHKGAEQQVRAACELAIYSLA